jgi:phage pi2 protein 07
METLVLLKSSDWEELKKLIAEEIRGNLTTKPKRFMKSAEVRKMLGGISAAKLQSLRIGGYLSAINADGLWLFDVEDIMNFINKNKINREEDLNNG